MFRTQKNRVVDSPLLCIQRRLRCVSLFQGFRLHLHLTFENDRSTYAVLEQVTEWGPYLI